MIVRTAQMRSLNENYEAQGNSIVLLYGRDGCEKEAMLRIYLQDKRHFYYHARQASQLEQYRQMAAEVENSYDVKLQKGTYNEIFNRVKSGDATKLVVIIDEFQYIVKKDPEFMDSVIKLKEKKLYPGPVQIILASSDVAWVEQEMTAFLGERTKKTGGQPGGIRPAAKRSQKGIAGERTADCQSGGYPCKDAKHTGI